jgi:hypothetical protein
MWVLILLAVHTNNPNDVPGKVEIKFSNEQQCLQALENMTYWLKFQSFKVTGQCKKS